MNKEVMTRKEIAEHFLHLTASGASREAFELYVSETFIHHNAHFKGDRKTLMEAMESNAKRFPTIQVHPKQILEDGDKVAVHSHITMNKEDRGYAMMHIFRFVDNKVVELWDFGQALPENTINENGMF